MNNKKFDIFIDCGASKIRACAFNKKNSKKYFYTESKFFFDHSNIQSDIQEIISLLEKDTNEYLNDINLMIDSSKILPISISISKKLDGSKLKKDDIQFLIQDAKQQILRNYPKYNIVHIIIKKYKIDNIDYPLLPSEINCNKLSIDIIFICLPKEEIEDLKKIFSKFDISISQILCTSYAKSLNYKNNFEESECLLFADMGFNKTSIICHYNNELIFFEILPIGGNHITKDVSKILNVNLMEAEMIKLNFDKDEKYLNEKNFSIELIQKIIFSRIEEILELSIKSLKSNSKFNEESKLKIVLMGEGSKILDNKFKEKISFYKEINLLDEISYEICESGFKIYNGSNKQEVVIIPKVLEKKGFFEKLFHLFR